MSFIIPFILMFAAEPQIAAAPPKAQMTARHVRDIGCIAFFGVSASILREGTTGYNLTDVRMDGRRWIAIVGERIMRDTGLPQEVVGFAITQAVPDAQRIFQLNNPEYAIRDREAECLPLMRADLAIADALDAPLPKPQSAPKHAPAKQ